MHPRRGALEGSRARARAGQESTISRSLLRSHELLDWSSNLAELRYAYGSSPLEMMKPPCTHDVASPSRRASRLPICSPSVCTSPSQLRMWLGFIWTILFPFLPSADVESGGASTHLPHSLAKPLRQVFRRLSENPSPHLVFVFLHLPLALPSNSTTHQWHKRDIGRTIRHTTRGPCEAYGP